AAAARKRRSRPKARLGEPRPRAKPEEAKTAATRKSQVTSRKSEPRVERRRGFFFVRYTSPHGTSTSPDAAGVVAERRGGHRRARIGRAHHLRPAGHASPEHRLHPR